VTTSLRTRNASLLVALPAGVLAGVLGIVAAETSPLYVLVFLAGLAVMLLALLRPIAAIYLAVLLIPLEAAATARFADFGVTPSELVIVAAAIGWLIARTARGGEFPNSVLIPPILALIAIHVPGLFLATDQFTVFKQMFMWAMMFILFLAVLADQGKDTTERLAGAIAATGAMVAAVAIVKSVGTEQLAAQAGGIVTNRAVGPFASPVHLGTFVIICVPIQLVFMLRGRTPLIQVAGGGAALLSISALALALSRSAFVALSAALIFVVFWWRPARKPALVVATVLVALLLARFNPAPGVFDTEVIGDRISSISSPDTKTAKDRFRIWEQAPKILEDNLPFGIGPKNLPVRAPEYDLVFPGGTPSNAHNTPLVVATELGIPGLIVAAWLTFAVIRVLAGAIRARTDPDHSLAIALCATFLALAIDGVTGYSYGLNAFALVVFLLGALAARIERAARFEVPAPAASRPVARGPEPALA
jgi:hypothetical protein